MKRIAILGAFVLLMMAPMAVLAGDDELELSDAYLSSVAFTKNFGPGTIDSVLDLDEDGVGFALSGLTGSGTGISDNFPLDAASGCTDSIFPGIYSDCSGFKELTLKFTNLGTQGVHVNVYMNTGFTAGGGSCAGGAANAACDSYWQGPWTYVGPGEKEEVTLDFSNAEAFNCADDPDVACSDGPGQPIIRLDEVTNIGFQVADFTTGGPTATWLVVEGD